MSTIDEINQLAFEHGQPAENGDGYLFSQEQFDSFAESVIATFQPITGAIDEREEFENYYRDRIMGNRTGVRFLRSSNGAYLDREVVEMWSGWRARAVLAQEAGKCEPVKTPEMPFKMLPLEEDGWFQCVNAYEAMYPLYTSPPAPVSVPDGWKLVPIEPTELMIRRGDQNYSWSVAKIYKAMIDDAPACLDKVKELNQ